MRDERYEWIALKAVKGIGTVLYKRLLEEFGHPAEVFSASRRRLSDIEGISGNAIEEILHFKGEAEVLRELDLMNAFSVSLIHYLHPQYPRQLKNIHDPPPYLYVLGEIWNQDVRSIGIVGARKPTLYGKQVAGELAWGLAKHQVTVVSGFAMGIDQAAHQAALNAGGRTIAVLGCGIDVHYPFGSIPLKEAISSQGAVLSEFPMGYSAAPENFPRRNRLISGLSAGVVVVEAAKKSGSLVTASTALEQGREVFAVPGPIHSELSRGSHFLIKSGAKLVEHVSDILEELEVPFQRSRLEMPIPHCEELSPDENKIYDIISLEPLHLDEISIQLGMPSQRCSEVLLQLELKGLALQVEGNRFIGTSNHKGLNE